MVFFHGYNYIYPEINLNSQWNFLKGSSDSEGAQQI